MADDFPQSPLEPLFKLLRQDKITQSEFEAREKELIAHNLTKGSYYVKGCTVNSYDGNKTPVIGFVRLSLDSTTKSEEYLLNADTSYTAGSNYNPDSVGTWTGTLKLDGSVEWREELKSHSGAFIYRGSFNKETGTITGKYHWDIRPAAVGTCTFTVYRIPQTAAEAEPKPK